MRILLPLLGIIVGATLLAFGLKLGADNGQIGQLQAQVHQLQAAQRSARSVLDDARAQLVSGHKNVITCGDLVGGEMGSVSVSGVDAYGNMVTLYGTLGLPQHCINR